MNMQNYASRNIMLNFSVMYVQTILPGSLNCKTGAKPVSTRNTGFLDT